MPMQDIFISYRRSDGSNLAESLFSYLENKGFRVFWDKEKMKGGQSFPEQLIENIDQSACFILIATPDVFKKDKTTAGETEKKDWVIEEVERALKNLKKDSTRSLIVLLPNRTVLPPEEELSEAIRDITDIHITQLAGEIPTEAEYRKILRMVTNVNRNTLWHAAHRWLENSKKAGARFANTEINELILPIITTSPQGEDEDGKTVQPLLPNRKQTLLDIIRNEKKHLYLLGEGGVGKTASLFQIMKMAYDGKAYSGEGYVPLFVELTHAPATNGVVYKNGRSTFIRRSIYQLLRTDRSIKQVGRKQVEDIDRAFTLDEKDIVEPINEVLSENKLFPEYLLLLDGLNEVSRAEIDGPEKTVIYMLLDEINWIIRHCDNVRIILTSRADEVLIEDPSIKRLYLSGVDEETILAYLQLPENKVSAAHIDAVRTNQRLMNTLRVPLFLTMYAHLQQVYEVANQGEILRMYYSERRMGIYGERNRVHEQIENQQGGLIERKKQIYERLFIMDFIIPWLAWIMEKKQVFYLEIEEIAEELKALFADQSDESPLGKYGKRYFADYRNGADPKFHVQNTANNILKKYDIEKPEDVEALVNQCVFVMGILQEMNGKYGFRHHYIRDFFAAKKNITDLQLAVFVAEETEENEKAMKCLEVFCSVPLSIEVRRFIGEYLGEERNKPQYADGQWHYMVPQQKNDRNLIGRALELFRSESDAPDEGYGIYNLIEILKTVREDLSGEDLSNLDLSTVKMNYVQCERATADGRLLAANLTDSKLSGFASFHGVQWNIYSVCSFGKRIAVFSRMGEIACYEEKDTQRVELQEVFYCKVNGTVLHTVLMSTFLDIDHIAVIWEESGILELISIVGDRIERCTIAENAKCAARMTNGNIVFAVGSGVYCYDRAMQQVRELFTAAGPVKHVVSCCNEIFYTVDKQVYSEKHPESIGKCISDTLIAVDRYIIFSDEKYHLIYDASARKVINQTEYKNKKYWATDAVYDAKNHVITIAYAVSELHQYDLETRIRKRYVPLDSYTVHSLAMTKREILACGRESRIIAYPRDRFLRDPYFKSSKGNTFALRNIEAVNENRLVVSTEGGQIKEIDKEKRKVIRTLQYNQEAGTGAIFGMAYNPHKQLIAAGTVHGVLYLVDYYSGRIVEKKKVSEDQIFGLYRYEDKFIVFGYDCIVRCFDSTLKQVGREHEFNYRVYSVDMNPAEDTMVLAIWSNLANGVLHQIIQIRHPFTEQAEETRIPMPERVSCVRYLPDGSVFLGFNNGCVGKLSAEGCTIFAQKHSKNVYRILDYRGLLYTLSQDCTVMEWQADGTLLHCYRGHERGVSDITFVGDEMYSAAWDGTVRRWQLGAEQLEPASELFWTHTSFMTKED